QPRDEEIEIVRRWAPGSRERLIAFAVDVARASRSHPDLRYGASIRGAIDFVHLVEGMDLDEETFYSLGCSAFAGRVRVKPTVARSAGEIIVEIMKSLRAKGDSGDAADLLYHGAPRGEPDDHGGEEPAGEEEGSDR